MKKLFFMLSFMLTFGFSANAADLTPAQEKAQRSLAQYLHREKFEPSIDPSDNTVCFHRNGTLYWISFDENSPVLYTIHRKGFKIGGEEGYQRNLAVTAANEVNLKHKALKVVVEQKKVDFAIQAYAASPEAFNAVFKSYYKMFDNADADFKNAYNVAKNRERAAREKMEEEVAKNNPPSVLEPMIVNVSFRLIDVDGNEKTGYDQPLRSFNARYIQPRLEFLPYKEKEPRTFEIKLKVTKPDGKVIYLPGKKYTAETEITMEKSKKNQFFEIEEFGTSKEGFWKAGEYKVEFYESNSKFYTTTFNIL